MKKAFTLAEVLITLGIIGIVAAMTMPSLVGKYRQKTVETRLEKFYSVANQAIKLSELKNGPKEYWARCTDGVQTVSNTTIDCETWYNTYLKDYLKTVRVEHFDNRYQNTAAYFADGSVMVIKSGYDIFFYPFGKDFDKNEFFSVSDEGAISRTGGGTKFFTFSFRPNIDNIISTAHKGKGIEPYRGLICKTETAEDGTKQSVCNDLSRDELLNNSSYGCNKSSPYKGYCTALIQENGWKIPDDYPFKF